MSYTCWGFGLSILTWKLCLILGRFIVACLLLLLVRLHDQSSSGDEVGGLLQVLQAHSCMCPLWFIVLVFIVRVYLRGWESISARLASYKSIKVVLLFLFGVRSMAEPLLSSCIYFFLG